MPGAQLSARGAYGFRITGIPALDPHLRSVPRDWPELRLRLEALEQAASLAPAQLRIDEQSAELWLAEAGRVEVRREPLSVSFATRTPLRAEALVHPFLGLPAVIASRWLGRIPLHAAAFVHDGRAYALLGPREAGKSTTLAALVRLGCRALTDDVLVVAETDAFAGPRSVDVREDAVAYVGGRPLGVVGNRPRWRLRPPAGPPVAPLAGLVVLEWGSEQGLATLDSKTRLRTLVGALALPPDHGSAAGLLPLLALPAWRYRRRPCLPAIERGARLILDVLAAG